MFAAGGLEHEPLARSFVASSNSMGTSGVVCMVPCVLTQSLSGSMSTLSSMLIPESPFSTSPGYMRLGGAGGMDEKVSANPESNSYSPGDF